jgi:hypothetical protein
MLLVLHHGWKSSRLVFPPTTSPTMEPKTEPTMPQPSQRKLWCAFSDDSDNVFSIRCTLDVHTSY